MFTKVASYSIFSLLFFFYVYSFYCAFGPYHNIKTKNLFRSGAYVYEIPQPESHYALLEMGPADGSQGVGEVEMLKSLPRTVPVLWVHGHLGCWSQPLPIYSWINSFFGQYGETTNNSSAFRLFATDFHAAPSAFHPSLIDDEAMFILSSLRSIVQLYQSVGVPNVKVIVLAHSLGGLSALRAMTRAPVFSFYSVSSIILLNAPTSGHLLLSEPSSILMYQTIIADLTPLLIVHKNLADSYAKQLENAFASDICNGDGDSGSCCSASPFSHSSSPLLVINFASGVKDHIVFSASTSLPPALMKAVPFVHLFTPSLANVHQYFTHVNIMFSRSIMESFAQLFSRMGTRSKTLSKAIPPFNYIAYIEDNTTQAYEISSKLLKDINGKSVSEVKSLYESPLSKIFAGQTQKDVDVSRTFFLSDWIQSHFGHRVVKWNSAQWLSTSSSTARVTLRLSSEAETFTIINVAANSSSDRRLEVRVWAYESAAPPESFQRFEKDDYNESDRLSCFDSFGYSRDDIITGSILTLLGCDCNGKECAPEISQCIQLKPDVEIFYPTKLCVWTKITVDIVTKTNNVSPISIKSLVLLSRLDPDWTWPNRSLLITAGATFLQHVSPSDANNNGKLTDKVQQRRGGTVHLVTTFGRPVDFDFSGYMKTVASTVGKATRYLPSATSWFLSSFFPMSVNVTNSTTGVTNIRWPGWQNTSRGSLTPYDFFVELVHPIPRGIGKTLMRPIFVSQHVASHSLNDPQVIIHQVKEMYTGLDAHGDTREKFPLDLTEVNRNTSNLVFSSLNGFDLDSESNPNIFAPRPMQGYEAVNLAFIADADASYRLHARGNITSGIVEFFRQYYSYVVVACVSYSLYRWALAGGQLYGLEYRTSSASPWFAASGWVIISSLVIGNSPCTIVQKAFFGFDTVLVDSFVEPMPPPLIVVLFIQAMGLLIAECLYWVLDVYKCVICAARSWYKILAKWLPRISLNLGLHSMKRFFLVSELSSGMLSTILRNTSFYAMFLFLVAMVLLSFALPHIAAVVMYFSVVVMWLHRAWLTDCNTKNNMSQTAKCRSICELEWFSNALVITFEAILLRVPSFMYTVWLLLGFHEIPEKDCTISLSPDHMRKLLSTSAHSPSIFFDSCFFLRQGTPSCGDVLLNYLRDLMRLNGGSAMVRYEMAPIVVLLSGLGNVCFLFALLASSWPRRTGYRSKLSPLCKVPLLPAIVTLFQIVLSISLGCVGRHLVYRVPWFIQLSMIAQAICILT